jgi:hypothetical protein
MDINAIVHNKPLTISRNWCSCPNPKLIKLHFTIIFLTFVLIVLIVISVKWIYIISYSDWCIPLSFSITNLQL